jgi:hypothetical protein
MNPTLPAFPTHDPPNPPPPAPPIAEDLVALLEATLGRWTSSDERRRMRVFGFRPAVEPGVLKRDWHGLEVRVADGVLIARRRGEGEVVFRAEDRSLEYDGGPFVARKRPLALVQSLLELIQAYERWVEAREGREGRLARGHWSGPDPRPVNALAETRRLQRVLQDTGGRRPRRR